MRTYILISCLVAVALAQFPPAVPGLKENKHFHELNQAHLPKDTNVLHATRQFLDKFAELKALADAAPDDVPANQPQTAPQQIPVTQHRFAAPQPAPTPAPVRRPVVHQAQPQQTADIDVNSRIAALLSKHQAASPTPAPTAAPRRAPVQAHRAPVQAPRQPVQQAPAFQSFDFNTNFQFAAQPQRQFVAQPQPQFVQAQVVPVRAAPAPQRPDPSITTHNAQGQVINPKRFPGPLAHTVPAGLNGAPQQGGFTPEVAAAHQHLVNAHNSILAQQARLPRPQ